mmetsp:Transcript_10862/g.67089  ORF Transcript_10862/g.67089 Transcript_10862/m.67089 type:complete len:87 (-) Transcript_10862:8672-8932(-)
MMVWMMMAYHVLLVEQGSKLVVSLVQKGCTWSIKAKRKHHLRKNLGMLYSGNGTGSEVNLQVHKRKEMKSSKDVLPVCLVPVHVLK